MDHVVYLDAKANEFEKLINGEKTMIIRGATGRKLPYGRVDKGDALYFINNNAEGEVKAKAIVDSVFNSEKMARMPVPQPISNTFLFSRLSAMRC